MMREADLERQNLLDRLLDAVKQCQVRFGGKTELATDQDSRVSCLCARLEMILSHGLRKSTTNPLSALKQMTGLPIIPGDQETVFWLVIKEHLTPHELQRYMSLRSIVTDAGRGRAWLRSTLSEHSLERYLHMLLGNQLLLRQFYEPWSFLLDEERSSMLPMMARGLGSILFAINIDNSELNGMKAGGSTLTSLMQSTDVVEAENLNEEENVAPPAPVPIVLKEGKKKKKKKKPAVSIVSFKDSKTSDSSVKPSHLEQSKTDSFESSSSTSDIIVPRSIPKDDEFMNIQGLIPGIGVDAPTSNPPEDTQINRELESNSVLLRTEGGGQTDAERTSQGKRKGSDPIGIVEQTRNGSVGARYATSFPAKTPPPTPNEGTLLAGYENSRRQALDADKVKDQLLDERDETERSELGTDLSGGPQVNGGLPQDGSGEEETGVDKQFLGHTTSESLMDREATSSPLHSKSSFHVLGEEEDVEVSIYPISQDSVLNQDEIQSNDSSSLAFSADVESAALGVALAQKGLTDGLFHELAAQDEIQNCTQDEIQSNDSCRLAFSADVENAALGLALAQKGLTDGFSEEKSSDDIEKCASMSNDELRQAVLTMMSRNDDLQGKNRSLRTLLDSEMEHSALVRGQLEEVQGSMVEREEEYKGQIQSLTRENEVLKNQLKKYVGAVQMLRRDGPGAIDGLPGLWLEDTQPSIPERKIPSTEESEQVEQYESKLIQVAEMHGELMEFNEYLTKNLQAKDFLIQRLREELVELRGPLPMDSPESDPNSPDSDSTSLSPANRALINLWIPSAFLRGKNKDGFHVYQVYVRIRDEEWNIYRRYSEFRELHLRMRRAYPIVTTFDFPPKKSVGNKDTKFVESRRRKLQHYLRCVINFAISNFQKLSENPCKETLVTLLPFFEDPTRRKRTTAAQEQLRSGRRPGNPTYEGL